MKKIPPCRTLLPHTIIAAPLTKKTKKIPILTSYFFKTLTFTLSPEISQVLPPVQISKQTLYSLLLYYACYMAHTSLVGLG
jgi:hypothetical protein